VNLRKSSMAQLKMNIPLVGALLGVSTIVCPLMYIYVGPALDEVQIATFKILACICGGSAAFCFIVGEITRNNSQMDKLWSLLPLAYTWVIAYKGGFHLRLVVMAILTTMWGCRLTFNFARKGAYRLKFWEGVEDYRWEVVRSGPPFKGNLIAWAFFDLFFVSIYQNVIVLMITFPALVSMRSTVPFGVIDAIAAFCMLFFIIWETVADEQQWAYQTKKWEMLNSGKKLHELPAPYNNGFTTNGLWSRCRHPNYLAEQSIWISFYIFSIATGVGIFNWSMIGAVLLVVLFICSAALSEGISASKYPRYEQYCATLPKFIPGFKKFE